LGSRVPGVDYASLESIPGVADAMVVLGGIAALVGFTVSVRAISVRHVAPELVPDSPRTADVASVNPLDILKRRD